MEARKQSKQRQAVAAAQRASSCAAQGAASISMAGAAAYGINAAEGNAERAQEALELARLCSTGAVLCMHLLRRNSHQRGADMAGRRQRAVVRSAYARAMRSMALRMEALALRCKQAAAGSKGKAAGVQRSADGAYFRSYASGEARRMQRCCIVAAQHSMAAAAQLQEAATQAREAAQLLQGSRRRKGQR
jgi:hypothetical protein